MTVSEWHSNGRDCIYFVSVLFGRASNHIRWDICRDSMLRAICTPKMTTLRGISWWNIFGNENQNRFQNDVEIHVSIRNVTAQSLLGCYKLNLKKDKKPKNNSALCRWKFIYMEIVIIMEYTLNDFLHILNPKCVQFSCTLKCMHFSNH